MALRISVVPRAMYTFKFWAGKNIKYPSTLQVNRLNLKKHDWYARQIAKKKCSMYLEDMEKVISECSRVLKKGRFCTITIGTNDCQLSKALKIPKENVSGLNKVIIDIALSKGLSHIRSLPRQIVGMANTMRQEYIVILQKQTRGLKKLFFAELDSGWILMGHGITSYFPC